MWLVKITRLPDVSSECILYAISLCMKYREANCHHQTRTSRSARNLNRGMVGIGDILDDGKAQPAAGYLAALSAEKAVEHSRAFVFRNAGAIVYHLKCGASVLL